MAEIVRFIWDWTGFVGAPGVTTIYAGGADPENVGLAFDAFLYAPRARMPDDVHIRIRPEAEIIEDTTGVLVDVISIGTGAAIDGANTGGYSAASGLCISWGTGGLVAGRRVRGRTFLVPMSGAYYDTTGTLNDTELGGTRSDLATFRAAAGANQLIWSRPRLDPDTGAVVLPGSSHPVTSGSIRDKVAILRSRRD